MRTVLFAVFIAFTSFMVPAGRAVCAESKTPCSFDEQAGFVYHEADVARGELAKQQIEVINKIEALVDKCKDKDLPVPEQLNPDEKELSKIEAMFDSMTEKERLNPTLIDDKRMSRIAKGSGVTVGEVSNLVVRFLEGQKMMRQMMAGGGIPGMPGIPGMRRAAQRAAKGKKGKKKGRGGGRPAGAARRAAPETAGSGGDGQQGSGAGPGLTGDGANPFGGLGNLPGGLPGGFGPGGQGLPFPPGQGPGSLPPGLRGRRDKKPPK